MNTRTVSFAGLLVPFLSLAGAAQASTGYYALGECALEGSTVAVTLLASKAADGSGFLVEGFQLKDKATGKVSTSRDVRDEGASVLTYVTDDLGETTYDLTTYFDFVPAKAFELPGLEPIARVRVVKSPGSGAAFGTYGYSLSLSFDDVCTVDAFNAAALLP